MTATPRLRALGVFALGAALSLTGCVSAQAPEPGQAPIVLSSGTASPSSTTRPLHPTSAPTATGGAAPVAADVLDRGAELKASDQAGGGLTVRVVEVRLSTTPGLVVVIDTRTRAVLGTAAVGAGTTRDVTVTLTSRVAGPGELLVVLCADDGDGRFDPATDGRVVDDEGEPVDEDIDYRLR
jgi:hypothetical protein